MVEEVRGRGTPPNRARAVVARVVDLSALAFSIPLAMRAAPAAAGVAPSTSPSKNPARAAGERECPDRRRVSRCSLKTSHP